MATASPHSSRPPRTAPVVRMYSASSPGRPVKPVIPSVSWPGPAMNPSRDMVTFHSPFPAAIWSFVVPEVAPRPQLVIG